MLLSYKWLTEYTKIPWSPEELAERLTMSGMMVEKIHGPTEGLESIVVGKVVEVESHPTDERLFVCTVDIGERNITLVTGATNVVANMNVPVALPGARLGDMAIGSRDFQGIMSNGMLCSEYELGVGDDTTGIMELPPDATPGHDLVTELGLDDSILELEIYPNRPDCQSVIGMAREVAALTNEPLHLPTTPDDGHERSGPAVDVRVDDPDLCPRYCAQIVEGIELGPSPSWMQRYLRSAGMRPINNVVDITNFVMLEMGQPMHAFDLDLLQGPAIVVRRAKQGETMQTLDGVERELNDDTLIIADKKRPVAIAGIMGGANSEVTPTTTRVLLEAATFNGTSVRRTARRLGLQTEASIRFEKGLDPHLPGLAIARAATLLAQLAGGTISPVRSDVAEPLPEERSIGLRPERVNRVLGTELTASDMKWILRALHFSVQVTGDERLQVTVPSHRPDVVQEVDLIEEIARLHGFDRIEPTLPVGITMRGTQSPKLVQYDRLRSCLTSAGVSEAVTYSFMNPQSLRNLGLSDDDPAQRAIPILNPISEDLSLLRTMLLPNMLEALSRNVRRQAESVHLFEIGSVFKPDSLPLESQPEERPALAIGLLGEAHRSGWGEPTRPVDFYDMKGLVEAVLATLNIDNDMVTFQHPSLHPGRAAAVMVKDRIVGFFGEVHPVVSQNFEIPHRVYVAEIDLKHLLGSEQPICFEPIPRHPAVHRDLALLAPDDTPAADIEKVILREGQPLLRALRLFDVYTGAQVPEGYRSLAYALSWQAPERTLQDKEIAQMQEHILECLQAECGVKVRT